MRKLFLALAALFGITHAEAQINTVPQPGLLTNILKNPTYHAISVGLVPASAATDILCLNGSATKTVHLDLVVVSGYAGTAITVPIVLKLNHSLDTGGTAATGIALPVAAPGSSADTAASATLTSYTANPTVNDSTPNLLGAVTIGLQTTTGVNTPVQFLSSTGIDVFNKGWDISKAGTVVQQLCINLNGATIATGSLTIWLEWQEN